jgi:hypothetical protein
MKGIKIRKKSVDWMSVLKKRFPVEYEWAFPLVTLSYLTSLDIGLEVDIKETPVQTHILGTHTE